MWRKDRQVLPELATLKNSSANTRRVLAAGFEPASSALEEQRLVPLGHASIQGSNGIDEIRTRVILIDNQVPLPLGHDPNKPYESQQYRLQDLNPGYSLIGQVCCQLHQAGVLQRTGSGRRPRTSTLRFQGPACCQLHHPGTRANDRTRTCIDESHNLAPHPFGHVRLNSRDGET